MEEYFYSLRVFILLMTVIYTLFLSVSVDATNVSKPLIYTRLRHDDDYLTCYRNLQKKILSEEKLYTIRVNETSGDNETNEIAYNYYQNDQVDASNITQDDVVLESLDRLYKSRFLATAVFNYDDPLDRQRSADPKLISPTRCQRDLDYLMLKLEELKLSFINQSAPTISIELSSFFDSYAGEESGLLYGNFFWAGKWKECRRSEIIDIDHKNISNSIAMKGRYCVASLRSSRWESKIREKVEELEKSKTYFKYDQQAYDYARFFRVQVGFCLPESCDSSTVFSRREDLQKLVVHKLNEPFKSYNLTDIYCIPDETSELRQFDTSGQIFILLASLWFAVMMFATAFDWYRLKNGEKRNELTNKSPFGKLRLSMSLYRNYKKLVETKSLWKVYDLARKDIPRDRKDGQVQLMSERMKLSPEDVSFSNAFRVFCIPIVLYGHTGLLMQMLARYGIETNAFGNKATFYFHASSPFLTDWFFTITGFVTAYSMFATKAVDRNDFKKWLYLLFHRYWRLAPMYLIILWFSQSIFMHTSSGPVWDYGTSNMTLRAVCRQESWIYPITLTSNFHSFHQECIIPTWFISNDMQFFLVTPFILILINKFPAGGTMLVLGMIFSSIGLRMHRVMVDPRAQHLELVKIRFDLVQRQIWDLEPIYLHPQYRISPYLLGLLSGHYVYMVLSGQWSSILYYNENSGKKQLSRRWKSLLRTLVWFMGLSICSVMFFSTWILSEAVTKPLEKYAKYIAAGVFGHAHATQAFGLVLLFITFGLGQFPKFRHLLTHPYAIVVSRLNFSIFIIQVEIMYWMLQSSERVVDFGGYDVFKIWIQLSILTILIAIPTTLLVEMPLSNIEHQYIRDLIMPRRARPVKKEPESVGSNGDERGKNCEMTTISDSAKLVDQSKIASAEICSTKENKVDVNID